MPPARLQRLIAIGLLTAACGAPTLSSTTLASPVPASPSDLASVPAPSVVESPPATDAPPSSTPSAAAQTKPPASLAPVSTTSATVASPPTQPPAPLATPNPTPKPTPTPTPKPRPTPTPKPKPTPAPTTGPTAAPPTLAMAAKDFAFSPSTLSAPSNTAFKISFSNADAAVPHNVVIATNAGTSLFSGKIITGVFSIIYAIEPLAAGDYRLTCIVHPAMTGALTVR